MPVLTARETIGRCELCGLVDHHLIAGVCRLCDSSELEPAPSTDGIEVGTLECEHCNDTGEIELDNNGPIGPCPVCQGIA